MDVLAVERRDEGLVQLGEDVVGDLVALMLDRLDDLDLLGDAGVMREHFEKGFGAGVDIVGLFDKEVKKTLFVRQEAAAKVLACRDSPLKSRGEAGRV